LKLRKKINFDKPIYQKICIIVNLNKSIYTCTIFNFSKKLHTNVVIAPRVKRLGSVYVVNLFINIYTYIFFWLILSYLLCSLRHFHDVTPYVSLYDAISSPFILLDFLNLPSLDPPMVLQTFFSVALYLVFIS